ncbi:P-loop containing nucleoside triphosphate hydrolases superfamily protein isoform X2 [Wolffia australiana]
MDGSGSESRDRGENPAEAAIVEISDAVPPAAPKRTPRRCVQKKINFYLPAGEDSPDNRVEEVEADGESSPDEAEGRRKSRRKNRSRSAGKIPVICKDSGPNMRGKKSLLVFDKGKQGSDFFLKISEKKLKYDHQVKHEDGNKSAGDGGNKNFEEADVQKVDIQKEECRLPDHSKGSPARWWLKDRKTRMKDRTQEVVGERTPVIDLTNDGRDGGVSSEGIKVIHPFFSQRRTKKVVESLPILKAIKMDYSEATGGMISSCPPIHVSVMLQELEERFDSLDWGRWEICDKSLLNLESVVEQSNVVTFVHDPIGPLKFDGTISSLNVRGDNILHCRTSHSEKSLIQVMDPSGRSEFTSSFLEDRGGSSERKPSSFKSEDQSEKALPSPLIISQHNLKNELKDGFGHKSVSLHLLDRFGESHVWTKKYRPKSAAEVCGNIDSVKFLVEWLTSWKERNSQTAKGSISYKCTDADIKENDNDFEEISSDSYSDSQSDDEYPLRNVLVVTGPVGCGKTAAVYASARELGFNIIEVNACDVRNGAHMKKKFGEAVDSQGIQLCSSSVSADFGSSTCRKGLENASMVSEGAKPKDPGSSSKNPSSTCRVSNRNLILFEDVDATFDEDRGLFSTIVQLAETSKRPIILTTNSKHTSLHHALDTQVATFTHPSKEELLTRLHMVCFAEGTNIPQQLLEQLVITCQGDIRKTVLLLQFWCQGEKDGTDRIMKLTYSPLQFDLDAAHWVLETVLPWAIPCQLALKVEEEISKAVTSSDDNQITMNFPYFPSDESLPPKDEGQSFSDDLGSPLAYTEGFKSRTHQTILSSDEDTSSKLMPDEITNCSHVCDTYNSFCPETEISNRDDFQCDEVDSLVNSGAAKDCDERRTLLIVDEDTRMNFGDINQAEKLSVHRNEGPEIMDESSRIGFSMLIKPTASSTPTKIANPIVQKWKSLRSCPELTRSNSSLDHNEAFRILDITSRLTHLISDADILLLRCQLLTSDVLDSTETPPDDPCSSSFYDEHLEMASTFAQHGLCFYAKKTVTPSSILCYESPLHLGQEMLAASTCSMAVGKLLSLKKVISVVLKERGFQQKAFRDLGTNLGNAMRPMVPGRLHMMLHGPAFYEYISYLSLISKSENLPISEGTNLLRPNRRSRAPRQYLGSLSSALSPGNMELFAQYGCFGSLDFRSAKIEPNTLKQ